MLFWPWCISSDSFCYDNSPGNERYRVQIHYRAWYHIWCINLASDAYGRTRSCCAPSKSCLPCLRQWFKWRLPNRWGRTPWLRWSRAFPFPFPDWSAETYGIILVGYAWLYWRHRRKFAEGLWCTSYTRPTGKARRHAAHLRQSLSKCCTNSSASCALKKCTMFIPINGTVCSGSYVAMRQSCLVWGGSLASWWNGWFNEKMAWCSGSKLSWVVDWSSFSYTFCLRPTERVSRTVTIDFQSPTAFC